MHPGYGFLSENVIFRDAVNKINKIFIGPPSQAISLMGDKIESKKIAKDAGVSIVPGGLDVIKDIKKELREAKKIGIKTVAICSDPDLNSPPINLADEYINICGNTSA